MPRVFGVEKICSLPWLPHPGRPQGAGGRVLEHAELVAELERRLGSRQMAVAALDAFVAVVSEEVAAGGKVALTGFGVFEATPDRVGGPVPRFRGRSRTRLRGRTGFSFFCMSAARACASACDGHRSILAPQSMDSSLKFPAEEQPSRLSWRNVAASYWPGRPIRLFASLSSVILTTLPICGIAVFNLAATTCGSWGTALAEVPGVEGRAEARDCVADVDGCAAGALVVLLAPPPPEQPVIVRVRATSAVRRRIWQFGRKQAQGVTNGPELLTVRAQLARSCPSGNVPLGGASWVGP
jgi:hypothetical protein